VMPHWQGHNWPPIWALAPFPPSGPPTPSHDLLLPSSPVPDGLPRSEGPLH
jgi:hypothetical protein